MEKSDLILELSRRTGMTRKESAAAVNTALDIIVESLKQGEKVRLIGFGSFLVKHRPGRWLRNPATNEKIFSSAKRVVTFHAARSMQDALAE